MNLAFVLKVFYREVLPERKDISMIHLGDIRHIAMVNLIISGGSPVVCMELAGYEDIDVSSNYYANKINVLNVILMEIELMREDADLSELRRMDLSERYSISVKLDIIVHIIPKNL